MGLPGNVFVLLLIAVFGLILPVSSQAQLSFEPRLHYGFVMKHHMDMASYTGYHFMAYELSVVRAGKGDKAWQQAYGNPSTGLSYFYSGLGETRILGDVHALTAWIRFPLTGNKDGNGMHLRTGLGAGYFHKKFDRYDNYKNLSIGSHINANLSIMLEGRIRLSKHWRLAPGLTLMHFSNGTLVTPNYGINLPLLSMALAYTPKGQGVAENKEIIEPGPDGKHLLLSVQHAIKEIHPILGPKYQVFSLSADYLMRKDRSGFLGLGLDVFWDSSELELLKRAGKERNSDMSVIKPGIKALRQWALGDLRLDLELGVYLLEKEKSDGPVYDRIGIKYFITPRHFVSLCLKTHYARADFIGWGIGIDLTPHKKAISL